MVNASPESCVNHRNRCASQCSKTLFPMKSNLTDPDHAARVRPAALGLAEAP